MTRPVLLTAVACLLLAGCSLGADDPGDSAPASTSDVSDPATSVAPGPAATEYEMYVALGDSLAAGYQPTNAGDPTDLEGGYVGAVRSGLGQAAPPRLVNLGCPGETAVTLVEGGRCTYPEGSQLEAAEALLAERQGDGDDVLVTVQVGANDVQRCVTLRGQAPAIDESCVAAGVESVAARLPALLSRLRSAAPDADIVVVDYYNPFVVAALLGPRAEELAVRSEQVQRELNEIIASAADAAGARVATVAGAFTAGPGTATPAVGPVCSLTWMCAEPPDIHPTDAGYAVIADRVLQAVNGSR